MFKHFNMTKFILICFTLLFSTINSFAADYQVGMRTRYQTVYDNWLGDATALTTRLKLTAKYQLDDDQQWQVLLQPNYVFAVNKNDYNSVTVTRNTSPIPDPHGFKLLQAQLHYDSNNNWQATLGRQRLSFDNERFIGGIDFWQTPQTFDALKLTYNNHINFNVRYVYSNKVHRIFGQHAKITLPENDIRYGILTQRPVNELGIHRLNSHLLNIHYKTNNNLSITGYSYLIENKDQRLFSTNTLGIRIQDEFKPSKIKYRYTLEIAQQKDAFNNSNRYQTWYSLIETSVQYKSHQLQLSQEILANDKGVGFKTPLATNHKFQGWGDTFTGYAMQTGLRDQYLTYRGRLKKLRWRAVLHNFASFNENRIIGSEIDLELAYRYTRKWEFKLVYANYNAKNGLKSFPKAKIDLSTLFVSVAYNI